jgi:hypothetical protein
MTHLETDWINENLELNFGEIRSLATRLSSTDLETLEDTLAVLETGADQLREMVLVMPHRRC